MLISNSGRLGFNFRIIINITFKSIIPNTFFRSLTTSNKQFSFFKLIIITPKYPPYPLLQLSRELTPYPNRFQLIVMFL